MYYQKLAQWSFKDLQCLPVSVRRYSLYLFKTANKIARIGKAALKCDIIDRNIFLCEKWQGFFQPKLTNVIAKTAVIVLRKFFGKRYRVNI